MFDEVKQVIINHCSPVLMGVKPAALFMLRSENALPCLSALLPRNVKILILRKNEGRFLVMLYEKTLLEKTLAGDPIRIFLSERGYPAGSSVFFQLRYLKKQFEYLDFPHEVGLFLGYPIEDVLGFVEHKGQDYKLCGYWKVYGDVEKAKLCFRQYNYCRECMKNYYGRPGRA